MLWHQYLALSILGTIVFPPQSVALKNGWISNGFSYIDYINPLYVANFVGSVVGFLNVLKYTPPAPPPCHSLGWIVHLANPNSLRSWDLNFTTASLLLKLQFRKRSAAEGYSP